MAAKNIEVATMIKFFPLILLFVGSALCSDVIELTDSNFDNTIKDKDILLIEFYAPW